jgi:hypothetical protein
LYLGIGAVSGLDMLFVGNSRISYSSNLKWHNVRPYEKGANSYAEEYFRKYYNVDWDESNYPLY